MIAANGFSRVLYEGLVFVIDIYQVVQLLRFIGLTRYCHSSWVRNIEMGKDSSVGCS